MARIGETVERTSTDAHPNIFSFWYFCSSSLVLTLSLRLTPRSSFRSDDIIESVTKMTIPEIFAEEGEDGFREVETSVLAEVAAYKKCVVATGGGIVKLRENWMHLRNGVVLCLSGPASLLARRVVVGGGKVIVIITKSTLTHRSQNHLTSFVHKENERTTLT